MAITQHSIHWPHCEMVLKHLFVGDVMRSCGQQHLPRIEMLQSQVDTSGYDIVLEAHGVMRHLQRKSSHVGAATLGVGINIEVANKPSGGVIWRYFEPDSLTFDRFLWPGEKPGEPRGSLEGYKTGTHTKPNPQGIKTQRANIRDLPKGKFQRLDTIQDAVEALFGA